MPLRRLDFCDHLPVMTSHRCMRTCLERGTRRYPVPPLGGFPGARPFVRGAGVAPHRAEPTAATSGTKSMDSRPRPVRSPSGLASAPHTHESAREDCGRRRRRTPSSKTNGPRGTLVPFTPALPASDPPATGLAEHGSHSEVVCNI